MALHNKVTPNERDYILAKAEAGWSRKEIAEVTGRHPSTIRRVCNEAGISLFKKEHTVEDVRALRKLYAEGYSLREIAARLGFHEGTVVRMVRDYVVHTRHPRWSKEETETLIRMRREGYLLREIAPVLGVSEKRMKRRLAYLRSQGVKI